jgi:hypothetical protein
MQIENIDLTTPSSLGAGGKRMQLWEKASENVETKLSAFPRFVDRTALGRFLVKNEIFNRVLDVSGAIVECGVHVGGGLFTWANLSALYEPLNHRRRVIGFDTFEGFPQVVDADRAGGSQHAHEGGYRGGSLEEMHEAIELFDVDRPLAHIPKVHLVCGDFCEVAKEFLEANSHLVISLLYLDFDVYEPTRTALELFLERMPRGGIVAFDQLNCAEWPGETKALHDVVGVRKAKLQRLPFSSICWWQLD